MMGRTWRRQPSAPSAPSPSWPLPELHVAPTIVVFRNSNCCPRQGGTKLSVVTFLLHTGT